MAEQCFCSRFNQETPLTGPFPVTHKHVSLGICQTRHSYLKTNSVRYSRWGTDGEQLPKGLSALSLVTWSFMVREQHGGLRKSFLTNIRHTLNTFISQSAECLQALRFMLLPHFSTFKDFLKKTLQRKHLGSFGDCWASVFKWDKSHSRRFSKVVCCSAHSRVGIVG